jgi:hypothetical protein
MRTMTATSLLKPNTRKRLQAALCAVIGAALVMTVSTGYALAADDEDNDWYDVKILRGIMRGIGLKNGSEESINYRERSPLVVPPSRDLPPPETDAIAERNPAWPSDPDVKKRKQAASRSGESTAARQEYEDGKALRPDQLRRGTVARNGAGASAGGNDDVTTGRPVKPSELGWTSTVRDMLDVRGWFGQKEEYAKFDNEPPRALLTDPPVGYQTPSSSQPYGISPKSERAKPMTPEERAAGAQQ